MKEFLYFFSREQLALDISWNAFLNLTRYFWIRTNTYGYPEQLLRGSESSQKVVFHQKNAFFIIFLGPIWGSLIQYNHISYIISCADANKKRFKYRTLFSPLRGSGALVIVLKTLSILFKDNLNFLFFSHMQEDVIWRQLHHSFCQPLTTPPYTNLFPGPTQCQCGAWLTQPYSLLKPPPAPFTNCKPTQDADHWPMTQSPIHAGCF